MATRTAISEFREKIKENHILEAISNLKKSSWKRSRDSKDYDLIYEGEPYPPKEILREAYRVATGKGPRRFPGGYRTNDIFIELGFTIGDKKDKKVADLKAFQSFGRRYDRVAKDETSDDLEEIRKKSVGETTKKALIEARLGQGRFRDQVLQTWDFRCCVTDSTILEAIRASHIKPWRKSDDQERLDPCNGLPLIANLDALFDKGLITFGLNGDLQVSDQLDADERKLLGCDERQKLRKIPGKRTAKYLEYHRKSIFVVL